MLKKTVLAIFLAGSVIGCDKVQSKIDEIDFSDLIAMYMQDQNDDATMLDWSTGALKTSPITWLHDGVANCDEEIETNFGFYSCRTGEVVITNNGKAIAEELKRNIEPGKWRVQLMGVTNGFINVRIESNAIEAALPLEESKSLSVSKYRCGINRSIDSSNQVFLIEKKGKRPLYINESLYCGAKACSSSYVIYYNESAADKITCLS